jgi:hypothetical protein
MRPLQLARAGPPGLDEIKPNFTQIIVWQLTIFVSQ